MENKKFLTCKTCGLQTQDYSKFPYSNKILKDGSNSIYYKPNCNSCTYLKYEKRYKSNHYNKKRDVIDKYKNIPCQDCGGIFPTCCMDFDHRENKSFNIATGTSRSDKKLIEEIKKCDVVCANCHRIRTFKTKK